jgi:hypothetical protein
MTMTDVAHSRRAAISAGGLGVAGGLMAAASLIEPRRAYAQASGDSLLRTVLDRGNLLISQEYT